MTLIIINISIMKLSQSQEVGEKLIMEFLLDCNPKNNLFLLKGSAGTGKSTLLSYILSKEVFIKKKIVFSATTNKAVSILQNMSSGKYDGMDVIYLTIHKLLKIKRKIDKDGKELFQTNIDKNNSHNKKAKSIFNYDIIVIDESSMISKDMMLSINKIRSKIKGKIIFLGDIAQLPPVNELESSIFREEIPNYELQEIMRYTGNLVLLANKFRKLVFQRSTQIVFKDYKCKYIKTYQKQDSWVSQYLKDLHRLLDKEEERHTILDRLPIFLVYTNRMCDIINGKVRDNLFSQVKDKYVKGEIIIFNNYYYNGLTETKYYTSQKMEVRKVEKREYVLHNFTLKLLDELDKIFTKFQITNTMNDIDITEYKEDCITRLGKVIQKLDSWSIAHYALTLNDDKMVLVLHEKFNQSFEDIVEEVRLGLQKFKKYNLAKYGKNKDIRILIDNLMMCIWEYYYANVLDIFADISYGYCITTHKSQGSTFRNVFIDLNNIIKRNSNEEESYRCLYTAITRSSKKVNILA